MLNNNKIQKISSKIGVLKNLERLYLINNELTKLPRTIGDLKKLKVLDLSGNQLERIPSSIKMLKNSLEVLRLYGNNITEDQIKKLKKLLPKTEISF